MLGLSEQVVTLPNVQIWMLPADSQVGDSLFGFSRMPGMFWQYACISFIPNPFCIIGNEITPFGLSEGLQHGRPSVTKASTSSCQPDHSLSLRPATGLDHFQI